MHVNGRRDTNQGSLYLELAGLTHNPTSSGAPPTPNTPYLQQWTSLLPLLEPAFPGTGRPALRTTAEARCGPGIGGLCQTQQLFVGASNQVWHNLS